MITFLITVIVAFVFGIFFEKLWRFFKMIRGAKRIAEQMINTPHCKPQKTKEKKK